MTQYLAYGKSTSFAASSLAFRNEIHHGDCAESHTNGQAQPQLSTLKILLENEKESHYARNDI